jgi:hypothetical protein
MKAKRVSNTAQRCARPPQVRPAEIVDAILWAIERARENGDGHEKNGTDANLARLAAESPYLTVKEAAAWAHVPLNQIRQWIACGAIAHRQEGKAFIVRRAEIAEQMAKIWCRGSSPETG